METEHDNSIWVEAGLAALAGAALLTLFGRKRRPDHAPAPPRPLPEQPVNNRTHHLLVSTMPTLHHRLGRLCPSGSTFSRSATVANIRSH